MTSMRTFTAIFILFFSVIHSAMAETYYIPWYPFLAIPVIIIAIVRCCCYMNRRQEPEQRVVCVESVPTNRNQTAVISTTRITAGVRVVVPPEYQRAPPYGQAQGGGVINSAYTPGPGTAYPPNAAAVPTAYPLPPAYNEAVKIPGASSQ